MTPSPQRLDPTRRTWFQKFNDAFRGVALGTQGQSSFRVHLAITALVIAAAAFFRVQNLEWALLVMCIAGVLVAELFNSSIEWLAKAIDHDHNPLIGAALDIASGAVLLAAFGAVIAGLFVFAPHIAALLW